LAAAAHAEGKEPEPPPLVQAALQHGAVDRAEYLDQPAELAQRMKMINYVYRCWKSYLDAGKQTATVPWARQHPNEWETVTWVMQMRREMRDGG